MWRAPHGGSVATGHALMRLANYFSESAVASDFLDSERQHARADWRDEVHATILPRSSRLQLSAVSFQQRAERRKPKAHQVVHPFPDATIPRARTWSPQYQNRIGEAGIGDFRIQKFLKDRANSCASVGPWPFP